MQTKNRFSELDALRGIAALLVVFFHYSIHRPETELGFKYGIAGVELFFVISGFVITMSICRVKRGLDFVINRISRLYPAYWAAATLTFALVVFKSLATEHSLADVSFGQYVANLTMMQYYLGYKDLDGSYWTLVVEMIFYCCVFLLLQTRQIKRINPLAVCIINCTVIAQAFFWGENTKRLLEMAPLLRYLPLFLAGINFYSICTERKHLLIQYPVIVFCFLGQLMLFENCTRAHEYLSPAEYAAALAVIFLLFVVFVHGCLGFIVSKVTLFLGRISYPLYLTHQFFALQIIFPALLKQFQLNFWVAAFGIALPVNIALAYLLTRFVDEPLSRKMKQQLQTLPSIRLQNISALLKLGLRWKAKPANQSL
jgi:peptidoglycan/LPS O-acetylase OafA/YrhL